MEGLTLIQEAERAGLTLQAEGDELLIRGPKDAVAIVRKIAKHKQQVLDALRTDWAGNALKLIAWCSDHDMRQDLVDRFEETAATLEFMQGHSTGQAEMIAFGDLVAQLLQMGIDCPGILDRFQEPNRPTD